VALPVGPGRHTEVAELHRRVCADQQDVVAFQVTVHPAACVDVREPSSYLKRCADPKNGLQGHF
jgi:3-mercaptopyruvate sulfurtransferase SseA